MGRFALVTLVLWLNPVFASTPESIILTLNRKLNFEIADEQTYSFYAELPKNTVNVIRVEQNAVDLYIDIDDGTAKKTIDGRNHVLGHEIVVIEKDDITIELQIGIATKLSSAGKFSVELLSFTPNTENAKLIQAYKEIDSAQNRKKAHKHKIQHYHSALNLLTAPTHKELFGYIQYALARQYSAIENFDLALIHYEEAASAFSSPTVNNGHMLAWSNARRAGLIIHAGDQAAGFALMEENARTIDEQKYPVALSSALTSKMIVHSDRYEVGEALATAQRASSVLPDKGAEYLAASIKYNLAQLNHSLGKTRQAIASMTEVLDVDRYQENRIAITSSLESLGEFHTVLGQCTVSIKFWAEALDITTADEPESRARILRKIGFCYQSLGQYEEAENLYRKALDVSSVDTREIARAFRLLGDLYAITERHTAALKTHRKALSHYQSFKSPTEIGRTHLAIAEDHISLGNQGEALVAIRAARQSFGRNLTDIREGDIATVLGMYEAKWGNAKSAEQRFEAALRSYSKGARSQDQIKVLVHLSDVLLKTNKQTEALSRIDEAITLIETTRAGIASEDYRASYFAQRRDVFEQKIRVLMSDAPDRLQDVVGAWKTADQLAARSLLDVLRTEDSELDGIDPKLAGTRRDLMSTLRQELAALERASAPGLIDVLTQQIQATRIKIDALEQAIANKHPSAAVGLQWQELDAHAVRDQLKSNQALLQFSVGEQQSYAWFVTSDEISATVLPSRRILNQKTLEFLEALRQARLLENKVHTELSRILLANVDIPKHISELLVVPDGTLAHIPLSALKLRDQAMLIDRLSVASIPSASAILTETQPELELSKVVVFADPVYSNKDLRVTSANNEDKDLASSQLALVRGGDFRRLPFSALEADAIGKFDTTVETTIFEGFAATKTRLFQEEAAQADILHLASHAIAHSTSPQLSGLILSQVDESGGTVDGFVGLQEIGSLGNRASLIVLSACESAIGKEILGEGMISLARGFMRNGTKNVIASQWRVPDKSTSQLMLTFYQNLLGHGESVNQSLRNAQLEIRSNPQWQEPFYWAGFSLWGKVSDKTLVASGQP